MLNVQKTTQHLTKKVVDEVTFRLEYFNEGTGSYELEAGDNTFVDMAIFDEIEDSSEPPEEQKQFMLKREFNGVRPDNFVE